MGSRARRSRVWGRRVVRGGLGSEAGSSSSRGHLSGHVSLREVHGSDDTRLPHAPQVIPPDPTNPGNSCRMDASKMKFPVFNDQTVSRLRLWGHPIKRDLVPGSYREPGRVGWGERVSQHNVPASRTRGPAMRISEHINHHRSVSSLWCCTYYSSSSLVVGGPTHSSTHLSHTPPC